MTTPPTSTKAPSDQESISMLTDLEKPGIGAYISFILAVLFFSGLFYSDNWWGLLDFTVLNGDAGQVVANVIQNNDTLHLVYSNFRGKGGSGAIDGFLFAITLVPPTMLAVGMIAIFEHYGALRAAGALLNPILRPLMGIPGTTTLGLIASLQSTDAGAAITRQLKDQHYISDKETKIFTAFQLTAGAAIGNFLSSGIVIFTLLASDGTRAVPTTIGMCLIVIMLGKVLAANMMRLLLIRAAKDEQNNTENA